MKYKLTFALVAALTSTAFAAFQAPLPEFKNEKQLAEWRAEKASQATNQATATAESAFYTGKPYLASSGGYAFKYRSYNPEVGRWTSEDPSGFPDGANNKLYVNNMSINCVDRMGLEIWQITNSNAVSGAGHTAMISGSGNNFQLQSYGSGFLGSASSSASSSNGLTTQNYSSSQAAINAAASQGYNGFNRWDTTPEQDTAARNGFSANANSGPYSVGSHNCANALTAGLEAAGVNHEGGSNIPNQVHTANKGLADSTGTLTKPE
jgi:RHS repeat-associated protein